MNHPIGHEAMKKEVKKIRIKVISSGKPSYWYANDIGKEFYVYENVVDEERALGGKDYIRADDYENKKDLWHQFRPEDCEIIS